MCKLLLECTFCILDDVFTEITSTSVCSMITLTFYRGVAGEGCGVTVEGSAPITEETIATPPVTDTKASFFP